MKKHKLNNRLLIRYSFFAMPLAFVGLPLYVNLPKYYAENFGISLASIGFMLLLLRVGDAIIDPLIGAFSDKMPKIRYRIIGISAACLPLFFALLFLSPSDASDELIMVWFAVNTALVYFFFSIACINYYSIGFSMTDNYNTRTKLSSFREGATLIGVLVAAILPSFLESFVTKDKIFLVYSVVFAALLLLSFSLLPKTPIPAKSSPAKKLPFKEIFAIPGMGWLLAIFFVNSLPTSITSTLFLFFVDDKLGAEKSSGYFLFIYFVAAALSTLFWPWISARIGKKRALLVGMMITILSFVWAVFLNAENANMFYIICILTGFSLGADMVILPSILADVIDGHEDKNSGVFGLWQALGKINLAMAAGFALPLLGMLGYEPGKTLTENAGWNLSLAYAVIPCIIKVVAMALLILSPIDKRKYGISKK